MFFSRQIGLANGQTIPVIGGGRVTGKAGRYDIAALNIETDAKASANVVRHEFHRCPRPARHPAPEQRRRHRHRPTIPTAPIRAWRSAPTRASVSRPTPPCSDTTLAPTQAGAEPQAASYRARFDYAATATAWPASICSSRRSSHRRSAMRGVRISAVIWLRRGSARD